MALSPAWLVRHWLIALANLIQGYRGWLDVRASFASVVLSHLLAVPLAELDGGELAGRLLIFDADGEFLFATAQGVADGAGAADLDGVGFFYSKL